MFHVELGAVTVFNIVPRGTEIRKGGVNNPPPLLYLVDNQFF